MPPVGLLTLEGPCMGAGEAIKTIQWVDPLGMQCTGQMTARGAVSRPGCASNCEGADSERAGERGGSEPPTRHPDLYGEEGIMMCWC